MTLPMLRHIWKETGEELSGCTDPPTVRERCETCGSLCWHYHGIRSCRFRRSRDKVGSITPEDLMTPNVPVFNDEPCIGYLLFPENMRRKPLAK